MAIPFKTLSEPEFVQVAGITIRKRGCLTIAEEMAVRNLDAEIKKQAGELTQAQADLDLKQRVATILIQSRIDKTWTLEKTLNPEWEVEIDGKKQLIEPDMIMLDALFEFYMLEQRRGKTLEELQESAEGSNGTPKKQLTGSKSSGK